MQTAAAQTTSAVGWTSRATWKDIRGSFQALADDAAPGGEALLVEVLLPEFLFKGADDVLLYRIGEGPEERPEDDM